MKKLIGEGEIEEVLQKLDRLTLDEARISVAQTLGVVHGLVGNVKLIMEGAQCLNGCSQVIFLRLISLDREASMDSIRQDLGASRNKQVSTHTNLGSKALFTKS